MPALRIGSTTWATALATRRQVDTTPTTGAKGRIALTNLGANLLRLIPTAIGARTTWMVDIAIPAASTGTTAPKSPLHKSGVMKIAPRVVAVVMRTDSATLPLAMYVQRLDACPPLMDPTSTKPPRRDGSSPNALPSKRDRTGIIA